MKKLFLKSLTALIVSTVLFQVPLFAQLKSTPKIGDKGPGGGTIFLIEGNTAYECSESLGEKDWDTARASCMNYKGGGKYDWELPNKDELNYIYKNLVKKNIISDTSWHWSSTIDDDLESAWAQRFSDGRQDTGDKNLNVFSVIAVRMFDVSDIKKTGNRTSNSQTEIIKPSHSNKDDGYSNNYRNSSSPKIGDKGPGGGTIFLIEGRTAYECSDVLGNIYWLLADNFCKKFRGGGKSDWTLPTKEQLNYIYKNLQVTGILNDDSCHWSSTKKVEGLDVYAWAQYFDDGHPQDMVLEMDNTVRAVRAFDVDDYKKDGYGQTISFKEACAYFYTYEGATDFSKNGLTPEIGDIGPGGGIVFYVDNHRAYECSDLMWDDWEGAKTCCKNFRGGGKSDWYLPSREELKYIYKNVKETEKENFVDWRDSYWSSEQDSSDNELAIVQEILSGKLCTNYKFIGNYFRAVRSFEY